MKSNILIRVDNKTDYMTVLEAVTGGKTEFTADEKTRLLEIYLDSAKNKFGVEDKTLVKAILAMDVPGANLLEEADAGALDVLCALCRDWEPDVEKAKAAKTTALDGNVSAPLSMSLARAALDAYAGQNDISSYREEVVALSEFLGQVEDKEFEEASVFLIRVRERVQGTAGGKTHE